MIYLVFIFSIYFIVFLMVDNRCWETDSWFSNQNIWSRGSNSFHLYSLPLVTFLFVYKNVLPFDLYSNWHVFVIQWKTDLSYIQNEFKQSMQLLFVNSKFSIALVLICVIC